MGIADIFLELLNDLPFKDVLVGETYPLKKKVGNEVKVFPVSINTDKSCDYSVYRDLVPNDKKKSIIYLEKQEPRVTNIDRHYYHITQRWRVVVWMNMKLINKNYTDIYPFLFTVLRRIPEEYGNYDEWIGVRFDYLGQTDNLFSQYSYDEAEKQYLIYPYGSFGLDYDVSFRMSRDCFEDVTLNPDLC